MNYKKLTFSTKLPFGKHKGLSVYEVFKQEPSYLEWLIPKWEGEICYKVKQAVKDKSPATTTKSSSKFRSAPLVSIPTESIIFTVQKSFDTFPKGKRVSLEFLQKRYSSARIQELISTIYLQ